MGRLEVSLLLQDKGGGREGTLRMLFLIAMADFVRAELGPVAHFAM